MKALLKICLVLFSIHVFAQHQDTPPALEGRWNLIIDNYKNKQAPAWLEMRHSGNQKSLVGRVMIESGSSRPVSKIVVDGARFFFSIPPQWDRSEIDVRLDGNMVGDKIEGTLTNWDGKIYKWTGERAPSLQRAKMPEWGKEIALFNGKDLTGWHADGANQWVVENGVLISAQKGANLISDQQFTDFKLHIEFRYPNGKNSGIYLRGRYELQITDAKGKLPSDVEFGGIYGVNEPNQMAAKDANEWQSFDVVLVGRTVTVIANGIKVISEQTIPGITGGALDNREAEPGPIMFQGDHDPIQFRNILVTPAK